MSFSRSQPDSKEATQQTDEFDIVPGPIHEDHGTDEFATVAPAPTAEEWTPPHDFEDYLDELQGFEDATLDDPPMTTRNRLRDREERLARVRRTARITKFAAIGAIALLLTIVIGAQVAGRDNVRNNVSAFGVDLGGKTEADARIALTDEVNARRNVPLLLTDGDRRWEIPAGDLGLTMNVDEALDAALREGHEGVNRDRFAIGWLLKRDGVEVGHEAISVDGPKLDAVLAQLQNDVNQPRIDPWLTIDPASGPQFIHAQIGRALDVDATRQSLIQSIAGDGSPVALTIIEDNPTAWDEDYATARVALDRIWSAPIEFVAAGQTWTVYPDQIARWTEVVQSKAPGQPATIKTNEQWVSDIIDQIALGINREPKSPRVWWGQGGALYVFQEGEVGYKLRWDDSFAMVKDSVTGATEFDRVDLPADEKKSPPLPANMADLGIATLLGEASTPYGGGMPERMHNIELAASRLNGTLIMPGQMFSFNAEVGHTTVEAGFQVAYGIANENGNLTTIPSEAGGICQVATTVFQPIFWLGYEIDMRSTHSYWIPNYASRGYVGLDATVDEVTGLDLRWTNNSGTAILMEAATDGQNFTVRFYGTYPPWNVDVYEPAISDVVEAKPEPVYEPSDTIPVGNERQIERAHNGFFVSVQRTVTRWDGGVNTEYFTANYGPSRNVVLVGSEDGTLPAGYSNP